MLLHCWLIYNNAATSSKRTSSFWEQEYPVNLESNVYVLSSVELSYYMHWSQSPVGTQRAFPLALTPSGWTTYMAPIQPQQERTPGRIVFSLVLTEKQYTAQHPNCTSLATNTVTSKEYLSWQCENLDTIVCVSAEVAIVAAFVLTLTSWPGQRQPYLWNAQSPVLLLLLPCPG